MGQPAPIGPFTPREIEALVAELPARQKSELAWAAPAVRAAVTRLLEEELTPQLVVEVAEQYIRATQNVLGVVTFLAKIDPRDYRAAMEKKLLDLGPRITGYFGETLHATRMARAFVTLVVMGAVGFLELLKASRAPEWPAQLEQLKNLKIDAAAPEAGMLRGVVLCAAILDAMDRGVAHERAMLLVERADAEAWPLAWLLANTELFPGLGKLKIPSYFPPEPVATPEPQFKTAIARELWEQRRKIEAEGLTPLDSAGVEAEVASRRGRPVS